MKEFLKVIAKIIEIILIIFGILFLLILFHELYHLHLDGEAVGLCIGNCNVYGEFAPAVIYWEHLKELIPKNEETNAWIFSWLSCSFIFFIYILGGVILKDE